MPTSRTPSARRQGAVRAECLKKHRVAPRASGVVVNDWARLTLTRAPSLWCAHVSDGPRKCEMTLKLSVFMQEDDAHEGKIIAGEEGGKHE